jgi:hypothetical protein
LFQHCFKHRPAAKKHDVKAREKRRMDAPLPLQLRMQGELLIDATEI